MTTTPIRYGQSIFQLNQVIRESYPYISEINPLTDCTNFAEAPLQRLILLDRYALKDFTLSTLAPGDLVVVTIKDDSKWPTRGFGQVISFDERYATIQLDEYYNGEIIKRPLETVDKPLELYVEQIARRVARGVAAVEEENIREKWQVEFTSLISNLDLVPAGRVWFGAGNPAAVTWLNCFVINSPKDSRRGIAEHIADHMDIMAAGGGVGSNMSTLRPLHSRVISVNGASSGMVSWTHYVAQLTNLISQGGSRRGAQMKCLNDTHPEAILFAMCKIQNPDRLRAIAKRFAKYPAIAETALSLIDPKDPSRVTNPDFMTGANISICVSHEFMDAVENKKDWTFKFPDIENYTPEEKEAYDNEWHLTGGDVRTWEAKGYALKEYDTLPARILYDLFMYCAWASAEPGFLFYDNARDFANSWYYAPPIATNPCAEQWLPADATCCLSAINFANMYDEQTRDVNWARLRRAIHGGVRFLDNVLSGTNYPLPNIKKMCLDERRIGLGGLGLADLMIQLELTYGSDEMIAKTDQLMDFFKEESYKASVALAIEKEPFELFDAEKYLASKFIQTLSDELKEMIRVHGIRNVCINTFAPTGTTGSMVGKSTGIEPYYAFEFYRSGKLGEFMLVRVQIAQDWLDEHGKTDLTDLPPWFVGAQQISVEGHARVQAVIQKHIDSAVSKTCNAPNDMSLKETAKFYFMAYKKGLKGVTIYRDGSRFEAVLTTEAKVVEDTNFGEEEGDIFDNLDIVEFEGEDTFDPTKVCHIRWENGNRIVECGTE